jgi:hypothetical protein
LAAAGAHQTEEAMPQWEAAQHTPESFATLEDVRRLVRNIEDGKALDILALRPTTEELELAAMWVAGNGDVPAREGHPLSGTAAAIFDILTADEDEEPPAR